MIIAVLVYSYSMTRSWKKIMYGQFLRGGLVMLVEVAVPNNLFQTNSTWSTAIGDNEEGNMEHIYYTEAKYYINTILIVHTFKCTCQWCSYYSGSEAATTL